MQGKYFRVEMVVSKLHQTILRRQVIVLLDDESPKHSHCQPSDILIGFNRKRIANNNQGRLW